MVSDRSLLEGARKNLTELVQVHDELASQGGVVVLGGPRGVGKALLLTELRKELTARGRLVLLGRAEQTGTMAYGSLREPAAQALSWLESRGQAEHFLDAHGRALGVLVPGLQTQTPRARDKTAFLESLRAFFLDLSKAGPFTLLLADLHYADGDTREAIRFLAQHLFNPDAGAEDGEGFQGVLMAAARTDDDDSASFVATLAEGPRARLFPVAGLSREALAAYLAEHPLLDRLLAASRGRPEDVDELLEALPRDTDALLLQRVAGLDHVARRAVEALAVLGRPAPADLLASLVQAPVGELAQRLGPLVESRLLMRRLLNGELLFTFARPHHQEILRRGLSVEDGKTLHHAIGCAFEARLDRAGDNPEQLLAFHLLRGREPGRGVPYALAACEKLLLTFAYTTVLEVIRLALPVADSPSRVALLGHLIEARRLRGELQAALEAAEEMRTLASPALRPQVLRRIGELLSQRGEHREALDVLDDAARGLSALEQEEKSTRGDDGDGLPERALVLAAMAEVAYTKGDLEQAAQNAEQAMQSAPAAPTAFVLRVSNTLGKIAYSKEQWDDAELRFQQNLQLADENGLEHEAVLARINIGLLRHRRGKNEQAREILERALTSARAVGDLSSEALALLNLGAIAQRLQEIPRALESYRAALTRFLRMGNRGEVRRTTWNLANLYVGVGHYDAARTYLAQSKRIAQTEDSPRGLAFVHATEGDIAFNCREPAAALVSYEKARELFLAANEMSRVEEYGIVKVAWAAVLLGDLSLAQRRIAELSPARTPGSLAAARKLAIEGAVLSFQPEQAARGLALLSQGIDEFVRLQNGDDAWRALVFLAERYDDLGDDKSAEAARNRARFIVDASALALPADLREIMWSDLVRARLCGRKPAPPSLPAMILLTPTPAPSAPVFEGEPPPFAPPLPTITRKPEWDSRYKEIVGRSSAIHRVLDRLDRLGRTRQATVLVRGESGTGKELVAAAVHKQSERSAGPFVRVNCAALVETLLMSELFGHEKGSFTGAQARKIGRFELARGGTIFLDEIGDISPKTQVSLLRVLQERQFERVGGTQTIHTDAVVICATHRDLEDMVRQGTFREDLYYRLKGVVVEVPALRERPEDVPLLVDAFLKKAGEELGRAPRDVTPTATDVLMGYRWPGNIRELQNVVRSVALFCEKDTIDVEDLSEFPELFAHGRPRATPMPRLVTPSPSSPELVAPSEADQARGDSGPKGLDPAPTRLADRAGHSGPDRFPPRSDTPRDGGIGGVLRRVEEQADHEGLALGDLKRRLEFEAIANALRQTDGNITRAAALLKMKRPRLSQIVNGNIELKAIKEAMREDEADLETA